MAKLVSIIIPTFNEELVIETLLKSIKLQTYKNIETIIVDDESTDNTVAVAKKHTNKVYKRKHAERSVQRNFGAKKSKGDFLVFLDADMELTMGVIEDCVKKMKLGIGALVIPEKTTGNGFIQKVRRFERDMYVGDLSVEVARVFDRKIFFDLGGYDEDLTGPEDYDLPYRISKHRKIRRATEHLLHHEERSTLISLLRKKYYYAQKGAKYAQKHPELVMQQGNLIFRKAYLKNWRKFLNHPLMGLSFIFIRILEAVSAVSGFVSAVGITAFVKTLGRSLYYTLAGKK
jgi:glycosyltransferase involved in cell wall biosynthesis